MKNWDQGRVELFGSQPQLSLGAQPPRQGAASGLLRPGHQLTQSQGGRMPPDGPLPHGHFGTQPPGLQLFSQGGPPAPGANKSVVGVAGGNQGLRKSFAGPHLPKSNPSYALGGSSQEANTATRLLSSDSQPQPMSRLIDLYGSQLGELRALNAQIRGLREDTEEAVGKVTCLVQSVREQLAGHIATAEAHRAADARAHEEARGQLLCAQAELAVKLEAAAAAQEAALSDLPALFQAVQAARPPTSPWTGPAGRPARPAARAHHLDAGAHRLDAVERADSSGSKVRLRVGGGRKRSPRSARTATPGAPPSPGLPGEVDPYDLAGAGGGGRAGSAAAQELRARLATRRTRPAHRRLRATESPE